MSLQSEQHPATFTVLGSAAAAAEGVLPLHRGPSQRVDLIVVSAEPVHHLALLTHVNQYNHPIFVPSTEQNSVGSWAQVCLSLVYTTCTTLS